MTDTKECTYCGEEIKAGAIKCKHCHSMLNEKDNALVGKPPPAKPQHEALKTKKPIWKYWWAWAAVASVIVVLFIFIASLGGGDKNSSTSTPSSSTSNETSNETTYSETISDEFKPLKVRESSYIVSRGYLHYAVILYNPNEKFAVEYPSLRITARDENDQIIGTQDQVLSIIYPQQDFVYGSLGFSVEQQPAKVDIMAIEPKDYNIIATEMLEHPIYIPLEIVGVNKRDDSILGEVSNPNSYDIDQAVVTVIFRDSDGKIISGSLTFIDKIPAGDKTPFEIRPYTDGITDNYDVYANIW